MGDLVVWSVHVVGVIFMNMKSILGCTVSDHYFKVSCN